MASCGECKLKIGRNDNNKIECSQCQSLFHAICVNINTADIEFLKNSEMPWKCLVCDNTNRKLRLNSSPPLSPRVIPSSQQIISPITSNSTSIGASVTGKSVNNNTVINQNAAFNNVILQKLNNIEIQNKNLNDSIQKLNLDMNNLLLSVSDIQNEIKNLKITVTENENTIKDIQSQIIENDKKCIVCVNEANKRIEFLEKQFLKNNIEVHGVPFKKNENVTEIVLKIINTSLNLNIDKSSIDFCFRKFSKSSKNNKSDNSNTFFDSPIVLRFLSYNCKLQILNKQLEIKPTIRSNIFFPDSNNNIYINECLTLNNKKIYYEAKLLKKEKKYKYLWIRNNSVMLRYSDGDNIIYLNSLSDIDNLRDK